MNMTYMTIIMQTPGLRDNDHRLEAYFIRKVKFLSDYFHRFFSVGVSVFLPFGENICGDISIEVSVLKIKAKEEILLREQSKILSRKDILRISEMCIDYNSGIKLKEKSQVSSITI